MARHLRKERLIEEQEKREYQEMSFSEGSHLRLEFHRSRKRRHAKESAYIVDRYEIIDYLPGKRLAGDEIDKLPFGSNSFCAYLRIPHLYNEKFVGLCALCNMEICRFPRVVQGLNKEDCQVYVEAEKRMIEEAQISIEVEKMKENGIVL